LSTTNPPTFFFFFVWQEDLQERARRRRKRSRLKTEEEEDQNIIKILKIKDLGSLCGFVDCKKRACMLWMEIQIQEVVINSS